MTNHLDEAALSEIVDQIRDKYSEYDRDELFTVIAMASDSLISFIDALHLATMSLQIVSPETAEAVTNHIVNNVLAPHEVAMVVTALGR